MSQNQPLQLQKKRSAIELLAHRHNTLANKTNTRWVHGEANLADALTKLNAIAILREFMLTSTWLTVQDDLKQSAKKRKALGLDKLQNQNPDALTVFPQFRDRAETRLKATWPEWFIDSD